MYRGKYYFETNNFKLIYNDIFKAIKKVKDKSIDMIFADPPYFLSSDGITCSGGKMVSVNKGEWDKTLAIKEKHKFNKKWIKECYIILKDNGTIWISGTLHNIYSIGMALEEEGFKIINNITWQKTNPSPNLACKTFTHSTETILWARKDLKNIKYTFNYEIMKKELGSIMAYSALGKKEEAYALANGVVSDSSSAIQENINVLKEHANSTASTARERLSAVYTGSLICSIVIIAISILLLLTALYCVMKYIIKPIHATNKDIRKIVGISIARKNPRGREIVMDSIKEFMPTIDQKKIEDNTIFIDQYIGDGYGSDNKEIISMIKHMMRKYGVPMDTTYTGKAMYGMWEYLKENYVLGKNLLFFDTGGTPLFFNDLDKW